MKTKKDIVEKLLKENPQGLTIEEIAEKGGMCRNTASSMLLVLFAEERIRIRQVGNAKIHYLRI